MGDTLFSFGLGLFFVVVSIGFVLGPYFLARWFMGAYKDEDRTQEVAGAVAFRIAALHGIILGLVYAQELADYQSVRSLLTEEAVAIADVFNDVYRFDPAKAAAIQKELGTYVKVVVDEEWPLLGAERRLSPSAWTTWETVYGNLLTLTPATPAQHFLEDRMLRRITDIARYRQIRAATAVGGFTSFFWAPALIGLILVAAPFFVFPPTRANILLLSSFGAYSGVILFFIFAFANPFAAPGRLDPLPFEQLLEGDVGRMISYDKDRSP